MITEEQSFHAWAIVEIFGHQKIAGEVSNFTIGTATFIRVEVPTTKDQKAFTRFFGPAAIYSINPVTEEIVRAAARSIQAAPDVYYDHDVKVPF